LTLMAGGHDFTRNQVRDTRETLRRLVNAM
jgi:hypothetical protein